MSDAVAPALPPDRLPDPLPILPVAQILPHRPPMLLIDEVVGWEGENLTCRRTIAAGDPFLEGERFPGLALLEVMAQAVAAQRGLIGLARGDPVRVGFLVGCRDVTLRVDTLAIGEELRVVVEPLTSFGLMASYAARTFRGDEEIATAQIQVAAKEDDPTP